MRKELVIIVALMLGFVFVAPSYAGEGPVEMVYGAGEYYVDKSCKGICWLAENWWNCLVYSYGAMENTLETRKLSEPKWVEEEKSGKKR